MGIEQAQTNSMGGIKAAGYSIQIASSNVANKTVIGYKRLSASFRDLVQDGPIRQQKGGGVLPFTLASNNIQGDIEATDSPLHMAISGSGYFMVDIETDMQDNRPVFSGREYYSRTGTFERDHNNYIVNSLGQYLKGIPIDQKTGNPIGDKPQVLKISNNFLDPRETSRITYRANLPKTPVTSTSSASTPGSELLSHGTFAADPSTAGVGYVSAADSDNFINNSLSGGAITCYATSGEAVDLQMRWAKTDSVQNGGQDTWNLFYLENSISTGTEVRWRNMGIDYTFAGDGSLTSPGSQVTLPTLNVDGSTIAGIAMEHGDNGLTQYDDPNGYMQVTEVSQNGYASGEVKNVTVEKGRIRVEYSNGQSVDVAEITLARFPSENSLQKVDGSTYMSSLQSGDPIYISGTNIVSSALEKSNVDLMSELGQISSDSIYYSANLRALTKAMQLIEDHIASIR